MPKFAVHGIVTGSKFLGIFEAETRAQAIELALDSDKAVVSLCHQCSDECEDPEIHTAEAYEEPDDDVQERAAVRKP